MIRRFARPYARAMMDLAGTPQQADALERDLRKFEAARAGSPELASLFDNPGVDMDGKLRVVAEMATRVGISALGARLLEVLLRHHRLNSLGAVLEAWRELINEALDVTVADVRAAHALDESERGALQKALESRFGRKVDVRVETDPSLLGGFIATVQSEVWDASVRGRVGKFRESLK
ncbi:MAG TPA: ATP synthase F1 subunit delta [Thermoanaerobaculia bacterium]|nr:ATP synthase F1 subunit delta [Thermoanaerobaculia bacterium]